jgi:opacity protein-like surface antigen
MLPAAIVILCVLSTRAAAQDQPAPKWEIFGGYSFVYPGTDIHGVRPLGLFPLNSRLESNPRGAGVTVTYNFTRWLGLTADTSTHWGSGETTLGNKLDDTGLSNLSLGVKGTFHIRRVSPFLEILAGGHRLEPEAFHHITKFGAMVGGGLDVDVSRHFALRLLRADYMVSTYRYGPAATTGGTDLRAIRLQAGVVFLFGGHEESHVAASADCSVRPEDPISVPGVRSATNGAAPE